MSYKVLVVDDATFMRMMMSDILVKNGFEVIGEASNGIEAIEKYKELKPDLVTLDITMPEMNGIDALKGIRKIDSEAKVVMCSAMGQNSYLKEAFAAGATEFIIKPFQAERVIEAIHKTLNIE